MNENSWAVAAMDPALLPRAQALARRAGRPLVAIGDRQHDFHLAVTPTGLELHQTGPCAPGPLALDFTSGRMQHRLRTTGMRSPLARAVGLGAGRHPEVVDATAGLGQDAFVLASLGCSLVLLERFLPLFLLLEDALRRAADNATTREAASRMQLFHADAVSWLAAQGRSAEVIHLDPMYPERRKSALSGKGMQMLQKLVGRDSDGDRLLTAALNCARGRVVVKRPMRARPLAGMQPDFSIRSPKTRYDIYRGKAA